MRSHEERLKLFEQWRGLPGHIGRARFPYNYPKDGMPSVSCVLDYRDLEQEACLALWRATAAWDPKRPGAAKFSTFAWSYCLHAMGHAAEKQQRDRYAPVPTFAKRSSSQSQIERGHICKNWTDLGIKLCDMESLVRSTWDGHEDDVDAEDVIQTIVRVAEPALSIRERTFFRNFVLDRMTMPEIRKLHHVSRQMVDQTLGSAFAKARAALVRAGFKHEYMDVASLVNTRADGLRRGQQFGDLTTWFRVRPQSGTQLPQWRCLCRCGGAVTVLSQDLVSGEIECCGSCPALEEAA